MKLNTLVIDTRVFLFSVLLSVILQDPFLMAPISVFAINFLIRKNWIKILYLLAQLKILVKLEFDSNGVLSWFLFLSDKNTPKTDLTNAIFYRKKLLSRGDMFYFNQLAAKFQEKLKTACQKMPNLHLSGSIYHCFNRLNFTFSCLNFVN